jgi:ElaB/YqjD/DUF883 family membrane-anchored ribosome-binding protein
MGERTDAKRSIESSTRHMSEIAQELSRRASPQYIGEQAKEKALYKTQEWKEQMTSSPTALGLIGGALGAAIGRAIARNRRTSTRYFRGYGDRYGYDDRSGSGYRGESRYGDDLRYRDDLRYGQDTRYGYGQDLRYRDDTASGEGSDRTSAMKEKISEGAQDLKDRASELKDRAGDVVSNFRERIPSADELRHGAEENPMMLALGGVALGAIAAWLLPVSRKEREMLEPMKQRAGEAVGQLGNKMSDSVQQAQEKIAGQQDQQHQQQQPARTEGYPSTGDSPLLPH